MTSIVNWHMLLITIQPSQTDVHHDTWNDCWNEREQELERFTFRSLLGVAPNWTGKFRITYTNHAEHYGDVQEGEGRLAMRQIRRHFAGNSFQFCQKLKSLHKFASNFYIFTLSMRTLQSREKIEFKIVPGLLLRGLCALIVHNWTVAKVACRTNSSFEFNWIKQSSKWLWQLQFRSNRFSSLFQAMNGIFAVLALKLKIEKSRTEMTIAF